MFILYLLLVRIPNPTGEAIYLPEISNDQFDQFLKSTKYSVVVFENQPYMLNFMNYGIFRFKSNVTFVKANYTHFSQKYECSSEPCIMAFKNERRLNIGKVPYEMTQFAVWTQSIFSENAIPINYKEELRAFFGTEGASLIGVDTAERPNSIPEKLPYYTTSSSLLKKFNIDVQEKGVYIYRSIDRQFVKFNGDYETEAKTLFSDLTCLQTKPKPFFSGFVVPDDYNAQAEIDVVSQIQKNHDSQTNFVIISTRQGSEVIKKGKLNKANPPYFFTFTTSNISENRWIINSPKRKDPAFVNSFLERIEKGVENYTRISAFIDEEANRLPNVTFRQIGTDTYHEAVLNPENDVLVVIVAPWCHHCKDFKPVLNVTSALMKDEKVKFYWIDGTSNELPEDFPAFKGYPTLYLFRSTNKTAIQFDGNRDIHGIFKFLHEEGTVKFTDPVYNETEIDEKINLLREEQHKK